MKPLRVSLVQAPLLWEDPAGNRSRLEQSLKTLEESDLILLPEMFTTGFSMRPEIIAEKHDLEGMESLRWMRDLAESRDCAVAGSIAVEEGGKYFNRLYWVPAEGPIQWYDKRHTFTFAGEDQHYSRGAERVCVEWKGWKILLQVCYDLRFPENARNGIAGGREEYDLLIYVANWPEVRSDAWKKLLYARAIENQCYLAAVNRVGTDGSGIAYSGDSMVIGPKGELLASARQGEESLIQTSIDPEELKVFRQKFPVLHDRHVG